MKQLKKHLKKQITKWKDILNSHYKTDSGRSLEEYAKGRLTAYLELVAYINKRKEETHYKKPFWFKENEYQNSVRELREIYDELFEVALKLGDPIPVWF